MEAGSGRSGCAQGAENTAAKQQTLATLVPHAVPAHAPSDAFDDLVLSDVHIGRAVDLELGSDGAAGASCPPTAVADAATDATRCVLAPASFCRDSKRHTTTFLFVTPPPPVCSMAAPSVRSKRRRTESSGGRDDVVAVETDSDDDVVVQRRPRPPPKWRRREVTVRHGLATALRDVGMQVWSGALLLSDYVVHHERQLRLVSLVLARSAAQVLATDFHVPSLQLCVENAAFNRHTFAHGEEVVRPRVLDWMSPPPVVASGSTATIPTEPTTPDRSTSTTQACSRRASSVYTPGFCVPPALQWLKGDTEVLGKCSIVFASDVVYDPTATAALFDVLRSMLQRGRGAVIALERRVNFDAASLRIASTGYAQFHSYLCHNFAAHVTANARQSCGRVTGFSGCDESCCRSWVPRDSEAVELLHRCREPTTCSRSFVARRLALDGPHSVKRYFRYERTPRLELWQIYHDMKNKH